MTGAGWLIEGVASLPIGDVLGLAARATLVLTAGLGLAWTVRRGAARTRHTLWTATFIVLLALPAATAWGPGWEVAVLPAPPHPATTEATGGPPGAALGTGGGMADRFEARRFGEALPGAAPGGGATAAAGFDGAARGGVAATGLVALIWGAGAGLGLLSLLVGHVRFRRIVAAGNAVDDPVWLGRLDRLRRKLGIEGPVRLVLHGDTATPMTGGIARPVVVLPASAGSWTPERREVVLSHELIHVRRRDALRQVLGRAALALYWFHPLGWIAARQSAMSREQSCDEEVLGLGVRPSEYASVLVDLAGRGHAATASLAIPMIEPSHLERRVMSILDPNRPHRSFVATATTLLLMGIVGIPAAIAQPVPAAPPPLPSVDSRPVTPLLASPPIALPIVAAPGSPEPAPVESLESLEPLEPLETAPLLSAPGRALPALAAPEPPRRASPPQDQTCRVEGLRGSFSGTLSVDGDRRELSGRHDGDRVVQTYLDDLRLCMRIHGDVEMSGNHDGVQSIGSDGWVVLESEEDDLHRLVITDGGGALRYDWSVNRTSAEFDAEAREWMERVLAVLGGHREIASIRGEVAGLRGTIAGYRGDAAGMRGEIAGHRGHVAGMRGEIASERGRLASMNGEIADLRARIVELHARIGRSEDDETRRRLTVLAEEVERAIAELRASAEVDVAHRHIAEVEAEIARYELDERTRHVEERLAEYDVDARVAEVERQIEALDADRRVEEIERRIRPQIEALRRLLDRM